MTLFSFFCGKKRSSSIPPDVVVTSAEETLPVGSYPLSGGATLDVTDAGCVLSFEFADPNAHQLVMRYGKRTTLHVPLRYAFVDKGDDYREVVQAAQTR